MIDSSTAFDTYLEKIKAIENEPAIKKHAKVYPNDFKDDTSYYLAKVEEAKALELFKEEVKNKRLESSKKKDEALKEFKNVLFSEYSEYSIASLEKVFSRIENEYDYYNWLIAFEEEMEFITEFNELNKS